MKITDLSDSVSAGTSSPVPTYLETKTVGEISTKTDEKTAEASATLTNSNTKTEPSSLFKTGLKTEEVVSAVSSSKKMTDEVGFGTLETSKESQQKQEGTELLAPPKTERIEEPVQTPAKSQRRAYFDQIPKQVENQKSTDILKVQIPSNRSLSLDQLSEQVKTQQPKYISNGQLQYKKHEPMPTIILREDQLPVQYIRLVKSPASEYLSVAKPSQTPAIMEPRFREFVLQPVHSYQGQHMSNYV